MERFGSQPMLIDVPFDELNSQRKRKLSESHSFGVYSNNVATSPSNGHGSVPGSKVLNEAKFSLAKWFYDRLLKVKPKAKQQTTPISTASTSATFPTLPTSTPSEQNKKWTLLDVEHITKNLSELLSETKTNIVITGAPGSGKTAMLNALLQGSCQEHHKNGNEVCLSDDWCVLEPPIKTNSVLDDDSTFLLPQGKFGNNGRPLCLKYGQIPELIVNFLEEREIDRKLLPTNRFILGRSFTFKSKGDDLAVDRIFIRERLKELATKYTGLVKNLIIKMPCELLRGDKEIVELSGSGLNEQILNNTNVVLMTLDRRGFTTDLRGFFASNKFFDNMIQHSLDHKIILADLGQAAQSIDQHIIQRIIGQFRHILSQRFTEEKLLKIIANISIFQPKPIQFCSLLTKSFQENEDVGELKRRTQIPAIISCLQNVQISKCAKELEQVNEDWIAEFQGAQTNLEARSSSFSENKTLPQVSLAARATTSTIPTTTTTTSPLLISTGVDSKSNQSTSRDNTIHSSTRTLVTPIVCQPKPVLPIENKFEQWKQEISRETKSLDGILVKKAKEASEKASFNWMDFRDQFLQTNEACRIILDPKYKGECLGADMNSLTCSPLIEEVPKYWQSLFIEKVQHKMDEIMQTSSNLLKECVSVVGCPKEPTTVEKVRLKRLMEFCNSVHERTAKRVELFKQTLALEDTTKIVKEACAEALSSQVLSHCESISGVRKYHEVIQDTLSNVPLSAASNIKQRFTHIVDSSLSQLDSITKDLNNSASVVLAALQSQPDFEKQQQQQQQQQPQQNHHQFQAFETERTLTARKLKQEEVLLLKEKQGDNTNKVEPWAVVCGLRTSFNDINTPMLFTRDAWQHLSGDTESLFQRSGNYNHFKEQLETAGLITHDVIPDGNSQFRALAHQVYGTQEVHGVVRILILGEILKHPSLYEKFLYPNTGFNLQEYVYTMSKDGARGDHLTLVAFSNFYGADLLIYSPIFPHPVLLESRNRKPPPPLYCLGYVNENIYQPLVFFETQLSKKHSSEQIPLTKKQKLQQSSHIRKLQENEGSTSSKTVVRKTLSVRKSPNSKKATTSSLMSLSDLCINKLAESVDHIHFPKGALPEELIQRLLNRVVLARKLDESILDKLLTPAMTTLSFDHSKQITDALCRIIASNCSYLRKLSFAGCINVTTNGVAEIARSCTVLEGLNLEGCHNVGGFASQFTPGSLSHLVSVNLRGCIKFTDTALKALFSTSPNIRVLVLRECVLITDAAWTSDFALELQELDLSECSKITDVAIGNIVRNCKKLSCLKLSGKNITDSSLLDIATYCPSIGQLELVGCETITDKGLLALGEHCSLIHTLNLSFCKGITSKAFQCKNQNFLASLRHLDLSRCLNLNDEAIHSISTHCPFIQHINLSSCEDITDQGIKYAAAHWENLRECNLSNCNKLTDESIVLLVKHCTQMQHLSLYNCHLVTDSPIYELSECCPNLTALDLSSCERISDKSLHYLARGCKLLETLCLEETKLTDVGLVEIAQSCHNISTLKLAYCKGITDFSINQLAIGCPQMKNLDLSYCNSISLRVICNALQYWPQLSELNLRGYNNITDAGIEHANLKALNLSWCKNLEDLAVSRIAKGCPALVDLDLAWCGKITVNAVHELAQDCVDLRNLNLRGCTRVSFLTTNSLPASRMMIYR